MLKNNPLRFESIIYPLWRRKLNPLLKLALEPLYQQVYPVHADRQPPRDPQEMARFLVDWDIIRDETPGTLSAREAVRWSVVSEDSATIGANEAAYRWEVLLDGDSRIDSAGAALTELVWHTPDSGEVTVRVVVSDTSDRHSPVRAWTGTIHLNAPLVEFSHFPSGPVGTNTPQTFALQASDPDGTVVLEQNYVFDLVDASALLERYCR